MLLEILNKAILFSQYQHFTNNVETICMALNRLTPIEDEAGQELPVFGILYSKY